MLLHHIVKISKKLWSFFTTNKMSFTFEKLKIPDVILICNSVYTDNRGFFEELYKYSEFRVNNITEYFRQENYSYSKKNVIRGLHYQIGPNAQAKLVCCIHGEIFDVVVDVRKESPTKGQWISVILSDKNHKQLYIPKGFAHGFCVLSQEAKVIYKCTKEYMPEIEKGIIWNDSTLKIGWPTTNPILSDKDLNNEGFI